MSIQDTYLFTEGNFDADLVQKILPDEINAKIKIVSAEGYSNLLSKARSLLIHKPESKIILVLDADVSSDEEVNEKISFIQTYLSVVAAADRFEVFLQVPEIESIFLEDKDLAEEIVRTYALNPDFKGTDFKLSDLEFEFAKEKPKKSLERLLGGERNLRALIESDLSEEFVIKIRKLDFPQKLIKYIEQLSLDTAA
ncbi:MAG: hypothetical protein AAFP89_07315 [Bacteroidota bacterium]